MKAVRYLCVWMGLTFGHAWADCQLAPGEMARVDDWSVPANLFETLYERYHAEGSYEGSPDAFLQELIDNHLIARAEQQKLGDQAFPHRDSGVGFTTRANLSRQRTGLITGLYAQQLDAWMREHFPDGITSVMHFGLPDNWSARLRAEKPLLDAGLSPETERWASSVEVARLALQGRAFSLSLFDVWDTLNIQGRMVLLEGDRALVENFATRWALEVVTDDWASRHLPGREYVFLRDLVNDRYLAQRFRQRMGFHLGLHDDNPALSEAARQVSDKDIRAWYDKHADEFDVVEQVEAQWIHADQPEEAENPDQLPADQIRTGWLSRKDGWLATFAFTQQPGQWSKATRDPAGGWIRIRVLKRETRRLPPDSETVRYAASQALAWERLRQAHDQKLDALRAAARICKADPGAHT
ncbi:peptidylprolyl isomerase [Hahella sp. SMD15-11]|uniref:Peptidylprolyl isomerase n=1 Tax=Thermohahella caldifontis TaxID=3142973 RepID=A0AB39UZD4_9GAMM